MTGSFLMAVIVAVLTIVIATPEYAKPAIGAGIPEASAEPSASAEIALGAVDLPDSAPPNKLKGYRWPVRGGTIANYYDWDTNGHFSIREKRVHGGLDITWFTGAKVKAAHAGTVVAAGRDWIEQVGYDGPVEALHKKREGKKGDLLEGVVIDDGNGYHSVYTNLKNLYVKQGDKIKGGAVIGEMTKSDGRQFMRYQLVRMDGDWLKVSNAARKQGFPGYAREHVDPLAVLNLDANKAPSYDK